MALRLGIKISGVTGQSHTPVRLARQFRSLSPKAHLRRISIEQLRSQSGVATSTADKTKRNRSKNKKGNKEFSSSTQDRSNKYRQKEFVNEYDAVEQYELEAAKPRDRSQKTNDIYEFMTKLQKNQQVRVLPHLQPSNLRPYGSTDNLVFPEVLKARDWIRYPTSDSIEDQSVHSHDNRCSKDELLNRREYSTFEKPRKQNFLKSFDSNELHTDTKINEAAEEIITISGAEEHEEVPNRHNDSASQGSKYSDRFHVPWPSYSESIKPKENILEPTVDVINSQQTRKLSTHQASFTTPENAASIINIGRSRSMPKLKIDMPTKESYIDKHPCQNLTVMEPNAVLDVIGEPVKNIGINEPILNNVIELKKGGNKKKKPPEDWDEYCPEEEIIKPKCVIHQKEKRLPKLIPKDCPCVEPPEPCDVPPLPRLNLEVCEPRPDCPGDPCDVIPRADIDCWEYVEVKQVDCRTIPHKRKSSCNKCDDAENKRKSQSKCKKYSTMPDPSQFCKRNYSVIGFNSLSNLPESMNTASSENRSHIINKVDINSESLRQSESALKKFITSWKKPEKCQFNEEINIHNFKDSCFGKHIGKSMSTSLLCGKNSIKVQDMIRSRWYSTKRDDDCKPKKRDCKLKTTTCKKGCKKTCVARHKDECPQFCLDCPPAIPRGEPCAKREDVCCEKSLSPYPSYSECLVTTLAPFTNYPEYKCGKCGRNPRLEERILPKSSKKYSTTSTFNFPFLNSIGNSSGIFPNSETLKGKRCFTSLTNVSKPFIENPVILTRSRLSISREKHSKNCKPKCVDISYPNCPPRCVFDCEHRHVPVVCKKRKPPYPAFSECMVEELEEYLTECPYALEVNRRLQPDYSLVPNMSYLLKPPPPRYDKFDPKKEERCIREKLCLKNEGITQCCSDFGAPYFPLKARDYFPRNDRKQCDRFEKAFGSGPKFVVKYHTSARNMKRKIDIRSGFKVKFRSPHRCFSSSTPIHCKSKFGQKKACPRLTLKNCPPRTRTDCEDNPRSNTECTKRDSPYPSFSDQNKDSPVDKITECPDGAFQIERRKKLKSQFNIPGFGDSLIETPCTVRCSNPEKTGNLLYCQHSSKSDKEEYSNPCPEDDEEDESCRNLKKSVDLPDQPGSLWEEMWCKIVNYFKARDCPGPEEFKKLRLREIAEKAAKDAGLAICDPNEMNKCQKQDPMPKVITPECCEEHKPSRAGPKDECDNEHIRKYSTFRQSNVPPVRYFSTCVSKKDVYDRKLFISSVNICAKGVLPRQNMYGDITDNLKNDRVHQEILKQAELDNTLEPFNEEKN